MSLSRYTGRNSSLTLYIPQKSTSSMFTIPHLLVPQQMENLDQPSKKPLISKSNSATTCEVTFKNHVIDDGEPHKFTMVGNRHAILGEVKVKPLPPLPNYSDKNFETILKAKINLCSLIFNFSNPNIQFEAKEAKSQALIEIQSLLAKKSEAVSISDQSKDLIFTMISKNIFEQDVLSPAKILSISDTQYQDIYDPSWPHLQYIYKILSLYLQDYPERCSIDLVKKVIQLMNIPDKNGRKSLVDFLLQYTKLHMDQFPLIRDLIKSGIINVIDNIYNAYCAQSIISFLNKYFYPNLLAPHKDFPIEFLYSHLLLLFRRNDFPMYSNELSNLVYSIVENQFEPKLRVIQYLIKSFSYQSGTKQHLFVALINRIIRIIPTKSLQPIAKQLIAFMGKTIGSVNQRLADLILELFLMPNMTAFIVANKNLVNQYIMESLQQSASLHWDIKIREKSELAISLVKRSNDSMSLMMKKDSLSNFIGPIEKIPLPPKLAVSPFMAKAGLRPTNLLSHSSKGNQNRSSYGSLNPTMLNIQNIMKSESVKNKSQADDIDHFVKTWARIARCASIQDPEIDLTEQLNLIRRELKKNAPIISKNDSFGSAPTTTTHKTPQVINQFKKGSVSARYK